MRLHKPQRTLWNLSLLLFVVGVVGALVAIPVVSSFSFWLVVAAGGILLLGTSII